MKNKKMMQLFLFMMVFSGCNFPLSGGQASTKTAIVPIETQVAGTVAAFEAQQQQTQTYLAAQPTSTMVPTLVVPTQPLVIASAPSTSGQPGCLIATTLEETVPDGTAFPPGDPFIKTWTVMNSGSCDWTTKYKLVFLSGEQMGGISPTNLQINVPAGNFTKISLSLKAPTTPGTYRGDWALQAEDGSVVAVFWVQIVASDVGPFVITSATVSSNQNYTGACPYTYSFTADVTANMFGTATYNFEFEDGTRSATATLDFPHSGVQTVTGSRELTADGSYSVKLYIDSPNRQYFGQANFSLDCN